MENLKQKSPQSFREIYEPNKKTEQIKFHTELFDYNTLSSAASILNIPECDLLDLLHSDAYEITNSSNSNFPVGKIVSKDFLEGYAHNNTDASFHSCASFVAPDFFAKSGTQYIYNKLQATSIGQIDNRLFFFDSLDVYDIESEEEARRYNRLSTRCARFRRLLDLDAPQVIIDQSICLMQKAVDEIAMSAGKEPAPVRAEGPVHQTPLKNSELAKHVGQYELLGLYPLRQTMSLDLDFVNISSSYAVTLDRAVAECREITVRESPDGIYSLDIVIGKCEGERLAKFLKEHKRSDDNMFHVSLFGDDTVKDQCLGVRFWPLGASSSVYEDGSYRFSFSTLDSLMDAWLSCVPDTGKKEEEKENEKE